MKHNFGSLDKRRAYKLGSFENRCMGIKFKDQCYDSVSPYFNALSMFALQIWHLYSFYYNLYISFISLQAKGVDTSALWSRVADLVIKTVISGEHDIVVRSRRNVRSRLASTFWFLLLLLNSH